MPASTTEYDLGLLASAQIQSGHLLDGRDHPANTPRADNPEAATYSNAGPTMATLTSPDETPIKTPPRPFYRTSRGIVIVFIALLAIVGALVGGAVAGSMRAASTSSQTPSAPLGGLGTTQGVRSSSMTYSTGSVTVVQSSLPLDLATFSLSCPCASNFCAVLLSRLQVVCFE